MYLYKNCISDANFKYPLYVCRTNVKQILEESVAPSTGVAPTTSEPPALSAGERLGERPKQTYASIVNSCSVIHKLQLSSLIPQHLWSPENFRLEPIEDVTT